MMTLDPVRESPVDTSAPRRTYIGVRTRTGESLIRVIDESATGSFSRVLRHRGSKGHSSTGFSWGYGGSGPAETAHAILADFLEVDPHPALYQAFKMAFVATWPMDEGWTLPGHAIQTWLDESVTMPRESWAVRDP